MTQMHGKARARSFLARLARDRRGAISPMFSLAIVPILLALGIGLDVSRVMSDKANLQNAVDEAALALGRLPSSTAQSTLDTGAANWIKANLNTNDLKSCIGRSGCLVIDPVVSATNQVTVTAHATIPPTISAVVGLKAIPITATSTAVRSLKHIELALVLDNTGSMSQDNKLSTLVSAAGSLVDTLTNSAVASGDSSALKIAVVPFAQTVNVGSSYRGSSWLTGKSPYANDAFPSGTDRFALFDEMKISKKTATWGGCIEDRPMPYDILDTAPDSSVPNTMFVPYMAPDEPDIKYNSQSFVNNYASDVTSSSSWQTRQNYVSKYNGATVSTTSSGVSGYTSGPNWGCGVTSLLRLTTITSTSDAQTIHTKLSAMTAVGDTEIPVGLVWGWHVLSPNAPFADGSAYGTANVLKIVVLVTDGQNTYSYGSNVNAGNQSYYTALGYLAQKRISVGGPTAAGGSATQGDFTDPPSALDDRLAKLCVNMKSAGIIMYTVPVEVTDTNIKSLLQTCASSSDKYIDASSTAALTAAFNNIAGQISALRLAK